MTVDKIRKVEKLGAKKTSIDGYSRWTWNDGSVAIDWCEDEVISGVHAQLPATSTFYKKLTKKAEAKWIKENEKNN